MRGSGIGNPAGLSGQMTEFLIERLGHRGDGVAAGPIYASGALPGEIVTGQVAGDRLTDVKILEPSSDRVRPPCRHAKSCGGCVLQHASNDLVSAFKQDVVVSALRAQGIEAEIAAIETSPPNSRRRATLSARRTKKGALVGFHAPQSDTIIAIPGCKILSPEILDAIPLLETLTRAGASRKGDLRLTVTVSEAGLDVSVTGGKPLDTALRVTLAQIKGFARLSWDGEAVMQADPPVQEFGPAKVTPAPGAFLQATKHGEATLVNAVMDVATGAKRIVDLFAGCGTFSLPLSEIAEVLAVEGEGDMLAALEQGWRKAGGLNKLTCETRDLFRRPLLPDELARFDVAVIDPPRTGAQAQINEIARSDLGRVVMVSCHPVSFARDAATLISAGFEMGAITIVDQFRWSPHTELVASFHR